MTYHGTDGDMSDGISVISDCDSMSDRNSPMPRKRTSSELTEDVENNHRNVNAVGYSLMERSTNNEMQVLNSGNNSDQQSVWWNPSNIILFGLIVGLAAILSSQCWKVNLSHGNIMPEMSLLTQRIQDLERENVALKVEVSRLVELHHAGHDHSQRHEEKVMEKRPIKQKKVWTGADDDAIHIPKEPVKENYCGDEYLNSDDLFASYNFKKCENADDEKRPTVDEVKSKNVVNDSHMTAENRSRHIDSRRRKNFTKDDSAANKRHKFAESNVKNVENQRPVVDTDRNEKFAKIQEERQKIFDEATQKYLELQKKKQEKDRKNREEVLKESKNDRRRDTEWNDKKTKQRKEPKGNENMDPEWYDKMMKKREELRVKGDKDTDTEWYGKMMKNREELRAMGNNSGGTKQKNKENWYTQRANEREKVREKREKHEKQAKSKPYR